MSALPKQVAKQQKEVEELERQLYSNQEPTAEPTEPQAPEPAETKAEEKPTDQTVDQPNSVEPKEDPTWEQRYKTLNGMFQAEVPRLQQQNKELLTQLQQMQAQIADLQKPKAEPVQDDPLVSQADIEAFGSDLIEVQRKVAKEVIRDMVNPLKSELAKRDEQIAQLEKQLQKTGGDISTMTFEQRLSREVPDFDRVNSDAKFIAWLDEVDAFTGQPRRAFAEYAYNQGDVASVKRVVDLFKGQHAQQGQQDQSAQRQQELERQVQPTRSNASSVPQGKKVYTEAEASALFDKVRKLNMNGKYDEANQLEAELSLAYVEHRVR